MNACCSKLLRIFFKHHIILCFVFAHLVLLYKVCICVNILLRSYIYSTWMLLQRSPGELHKWLHHSGSDGILHGLHLHANFHDSWYCFHVIACRIPLWSLQRCSFGCVHCYSRCIIMLFPVQVSWPAPCLLSMAWQAEFLSIPGELQLFPFHPILAVWTQNLKWIFVLNQVAKRRKGLLNYMLFLRVTPTLPNTFINVASPIVAVPFHIFFLATSVGLIPAAFVTVRVFIFVNY